MDKPVQKGIVWVLFCSNRNRLVYDSLPSDLNRFIPYMLKSIIVLHPEVNIYIMNNRWEEAIHYICLFTYSSGGKLVLQQPALMLTWLHAEF